MSGVGPDRWARLLLRWSDRLPCRVIYGPDGAPYLERYFLARLPAWLGGWTFYLHHFVASDPDRGLHDHPWERAWSLILSGGYWEQRQVGWDWGGPIVARRYLRPERLNRIKRGTFHRVVLRQSASRGPLQAWSLFAHSPHRHPWGFLRRCSNGGRGGAAFYPAEHKTGSAPWWRTAPKGRDCSGRRGEGGAP